MNRIVCWYFRYFCKIFTCSPLALYLNSVEFKKFDCKLHRMKLLPKETEQNLQKFEVMQDDSKSHAVETSLSNSKSSSVINQVVETKNMVAVSDCEKKVSADEMNSTVAADIPNHSSEENSSQKLQAEVATANEEESKKEEETEKQENGSNEDAQSESLTPKLQGEELTRQLKNQLEYYFSRENLAQDPYLVSQMNSEQYVSIYIIANFNAIKKLTSDINQVIEALKSSRLVEVDDKNEMVRPNPNRCAIILREIPEGVAQEEVVSLFDDCPAKITYCEYAGNTMWYVQFDSENDGQTAYRYLRENVKEFKGKPILARLKTKCHHLNTYSFQFSSNPNESKESVPAHSAQDNQQPQVPPPVDFIQQPFFVAPPVPFSQHPGAPVAALTPSLIARVAASAPTSVIPAPSSGQGPTPMTMNPPFVVTAPWHPGFFPGDASLVGNPLANPFLQTAYKPSHAPQYTSGSGKSQNNSSGHRYTDYHKGVASQRNSYNQRKSSNSSYSQHQQLASAPKSRYVLTNDPNPPHMNPESLNHYGQADQANSHAVHSMQNPPQGHYLPAVNAHLGTSFVTPNVNDPSFFFVPNPAMNIIPHTMQARIGSRRNPAYPSRPSSSYSYGEQNVGSSSNGHRNNRYHARTGNNHHAEISPRFLHKGSAGQHIVLNQPIVQISTSGEPHHELKSYYSNKAHNSASTANSQRSRNVPYPDNSISEHEKSHGIHDKDRYSHSNDLRRSSAHQRSNTPPDSKNLPVGLDHRRNSKQRRARRNDDDDDRTASSVVAPPTNTTFNLESNSFPPLPGSSEPDPSNPVNPISDSRPAAADAVKSTDSSKAISAVESNSVPASTPKKYSEVSSASHVTRNHSTQAKAPAHPTESNKVPKKSEVKTTSSVNTQPVADKHPPVVNKRSNPKQAANDRNSDSKQGQTRPRSTSSNQSNSQSNSAKKPSYKEQRKSAPASKSDSTAKVEPGNKSEPSKRTTSDSNESKVKDDLTIDDKDNDLNDRRPTYAEIMKAEANKANQVNGKSGSDSGNSESGEDNQAGEDVKDSKENPVEQEKSVKASQGKTERNVESGRNERRGGSNSGGRRNDDNRRGSWYGRGGQYRDRNYDYRSDRHRDRGNGHWDYRGGRGGFRGRRGGYYRGENRYNSGSSGRSIPSNGQASNVQASNGQASNDR